MDPSRDECESTEDEAEEGENLNSCPHTGSESVRTRHVRPLCTIDGTKIHVGLSLTRKKLFYLVSSKINYHIKTVWYINKK